MTDTAARTKDVFIDRRNYNPTWWEKLLSGFNTTGNEIPKRTPLKPELGLDPLVGETSSPKFLYWLESEGFYFNHDRVWWQRVWTTWTPKYANKIDDREYPNMKQVWETYVIDAPSEKWTYRIVNPECLGGSGGGGHSGGWCIWEGNVGKKE